MSISQVLSDHDNKYFDDDKNYRYCEVCEFNGYPNEKVVYHYEGLRSEDEEGFITRFVVYDYPVQTKKIHEHKYNEKLINKLVKLALGGVKV